MVFFGPPDIEKLKNKRDIKGLVNALRHREAAVRKGAALGLADLANAQPGDSIHQSIEPLIKAFEDSDPSVLSAAVQALSAIGQPAVLALISALRAPGEHTREGAARAIGRLGAAAIEPAYLRLAADPLVTLLRDAVMPVRRAAAWALGRVGPRLETAQRSLPMESLTQCLRDPSAEVREATVSALGRFGDGKAIKPLEASLEDSSAAVRKIASESLTSLGWQPVTPAETALFRIARQDWEGAIASGQEAIPALIRVLDSSDSTARLSAIRVLGRTASPDAIGPLISSLKDPDEGIRAAAATALESVGAPEAIEHLLQAVRDKDRNVRKAVVRALGHTNDPRAATVIITLLRTHETDMQEIASQALVNLGTSAIADLIAVLSETDSLLRESVPAILVRIGAPAVPPLLTALRDAPVPANQSAAFILGEIRDSRAVWPLIAALQTPELTLSAVEALGKIGDSRAVKPLMDLLNSYSEAIQQAVTLALGAIGDPQSIDSLIQLLRAGDRKIRTDAANALIDMYRSRKLDLSQKRKILEQQDRISDHHSDSGTHQDENRADDWHSDRSLHEDRGIGLDFPNNMNY